MFISEIRAAFKDEGTGRFAGCEYGTAAARIAQVIWHTDFVEKELVRPRGVALPRVNNSLARPTHEILTVEIIDDFGAQSNHLPVGGTTGLCHESTAAIEQAAAWYREHRDTAEQPIIPAIRRRFGLTPLEAIMALREARLP